MTCVRLAANGKIDFMQLKNQFKRKRIVKEMLDIAHFLRNVSRFW